jgi:hypothetical protein
MRNRWTAAVIALAGIALVAAPTAVSATGSSKAGSVPRYNHIIEIMMENQNYDTIIGNPSAPNINGLATTYGLATSYFGVTHPSEPNYVANVGGDFFGIQDDNPFYCTPALAATDSLCAGTTVNHTVSALSLADQLTAAGKSWKGYFQNLPYVDPSAVVSSGPDANGPYSFKWPSATDALYASKHNPFINFTGTQNARSQMVPDNQLAVDLLSGKLPNYSLVVPDQCNDMHGTGGCSSTDPLIQAGDRYVGTTVNEIMASRLWGRGNNAIVVTWDEDDFSDSGQPGTGCCGADPGGGHVATIVITNNGARHLTDNTAYNHYSLLRTLEDAFGLTHLAHAGDAEVPAMTPLFAQDNQGQNQQ